MEKQSVFWENIGGWGDLPGGGIRSQHAGAWGEVQLADQRVTTTQGRGDAATMHASDTTQGRGAAGVAEFQCSLFTSGGVLQVLACRGRVPRVENYLRATGFYHVSRIGMIRGFHPLLAALVERWRPETHTFVLPVGEVTVTLEDVAHIFGLPIDGEPVSGWTDSSSDFVQSQSMAIFGRQPVLSRNSKSYIKLGWVRSIRDEEPLDTEESIMRYVRCQIFCLLGSTLFTDKSTAYAHAKYLPLLRDFERIHTYSWGSACLAHLYRALCRASRYDTKEMDGPLNLLFVWAWERMPCIAPVPRHILPPAEIPVAMRWSHSDRSTAWLEKTVEIFRHDIDYMQEFDWRPYLGMIVPGELHGHLDVCDIVAPLLSFECIEWHPADRVMRQFGCSWGLDIGVGQQAKHSTAGSTPPSDLGFRTDPGVSGLVHALVRTYAEIDGVCSSASCTIATCTLATTATTATGPECVQPPFPALSAQPPFTALLAQPPFTALSADADDSNFSAMHSPSASADPRGTSVGMSHEVQRPASDHTSEGASCDSGFIRRTYTLVDEFNPGASAPAEAGRSAPREEAGGSAAADMGDAVPGHPYDLRTERNPPDRYTPSKPGLGMMGKGLNWMGRKK
ncbi:uncharacterized protein DS421_18g614260 [Arachis hypogaea]|nr:uncharacterized protein DS421_18g614260 [Arachis hypogaea]